MNLILIPIGLLIGVFTALAGVGGGIVVVPFLLWWGLSKDAAVATSFLNMVFVVATSLFFYGVKGEVDWKTGLLLGVGSIVGVYLAVTFLQPYINEKFFRYFFAGVLLLMAALVIYKK